MSQVATDRASVMRCRRSLPLVAAVAVNSAQAAPYRAGNGPRPVRAGFGGTLRSEFTKTLWRDFLDATGTLHIDQASVTCALNLRSHHPALIDAGFAELQAPIPWWGGRTLRFRFPPR